ncbi:MAG: FAD-dependent oxidoreductase, partial [Bacteroidota bacterium]|nr:FAD-dependent oxidoreductase [Bacteroidota bacterium]
MSNKAIIIGSGIAGIATSIRLACQGYDVSVFEKNEYPGGKLSSFTLGDYRFDFGPSLFTMPHFVDELFTLAGENPSDHFQYKRKEIGCKYYWEDGIRLNAYGDTDRFLV